MENYYFDCQCSDFNHIFRFVLDFNDGEMWLEVHLNKFLPWYQRVWKAIKYIFNKEDGYGHYDVTIIKPEQLPKLKGIAEIAEEIHLRNLRNYKF